MHTRTFLCLSILCESVLVNTSLPKQSIQLNMKVRQHDCWTNALLKKDSTSSHCTTPHTPPVVSSFEGLCRWHAVCRNVCWGHSPQTEGSFHRLSRTFTWASSPALLSDYYINCPDGWYQFAKSKKFGSNHEHHPWVIICVLVPQFPITVCHRNSLVWADGNLCLCLFLWRSVFSTDLSQFTLHLVDNRHYVWTHLGEWFLDLST